MLSFAFAENVTSFKLQHFLLYLLHFFCFVKFFIYSYLISSWFSCKTHPPFNFDISVAQFTFKLLKCAVASPVKLRYTQQHQSLVMATRALDFVPPANVRHFNLELPCAAHVLQLLGVLP